MKFSLRFIFISTIFSLIFINKFIRKCHGEPKVMIGNTRVEGIHMLTRNNRNISGFMGIPYAEPPIGLLRFSNPILKEVAGNYLSAKKEGSGCTQMTRFGEKKVIGNEDCLFLNIYTPMKSSSSGESLFPVMMLIHGSAFLIGSGSKETLAPDYLLDKNIVFVSINYRLDIFGFLSTGDNVALGNFGIKDQLVALQWIQKYIRHFGGDPNQVTLIGYSTGADSVNHHIFSNITNDYFHRYIMQSGCPFTARSYNTAEKSAKIAKNAAEYFNCSTENSKLLVDCLRTVDYKILVNNSYIFPMIRNIFHSTWSPTIEPKVPGAYIMENPFQVLKEKKYRNLPGISGIVPDEGLTWIASLYVNDILYNEITENFEQFLTDIFINFDLTRNITEIVAEVKNFYFNNSVSKDKNTVLKQLSDFTGDLFKIYPIIFASNFYANYTKVPLYFYLFNYRGLISMSNKATGNNWNLGVAHTDENIYLYPQKPAVPVEIDENILKNDSFITDLMVDFWTSFIIDGIPTTEKLNDVTISWKPYQPNSNVLEIGNNSDTEIKMVETIFNERMKFWERMQPLLIDNFLL